MGTAMRTHAFAIVERFLPDCLMWLRCFLEGMSNYFNGDAELAQSINQEAPHISFYGHTRFRCLHKLYSYLRMKQVSVLLVISVIIAPSLAGQCQGGPVRCAKQGETCRIEAGAPALCDPLTSVRQPASYFTMH